MQCDRVTLTLEETWVFTYGPDIFGRVSLSLEIDNCRKVAVLFRERGRQTERHTLLRYLFYYWALNLQWAQMYHVTCLHWQSEKRWGPSVRTEQITFVIWLLISLYGGEGQGYMLCTTLTWHVDTTLWTSIVKVAQMAESKCPPSYSMRRWPQGSLSFLDAPSHWDPISNLE